MVNFYNSLSPTTRLLIQSLLAIVWSAVVTGGEAAYQSFTQQGHLNLPALLVTAWSAFLLSLLPAMYHWVPAHAQEAIQAYSEENTALHDALQRQQTITSNVIAQKSATHPQQQPAVIVQPPAISVEHVQALSQQIALNLANMAGGPPKPPTTAAEALSADMAAQEAQPTQPIDLTSLDTMKTTSTPPVSGPARNWNDSALMPSVQPDIAQQPTQNYQAVPQVPFPGQPVAP